SFGIFSANARGYGPGAIQNILSDNSQQPNSTAQPATPGQIAALAGSGLGPLTGPDNVTPDPSSLPTPVEVFVGGRPAAVAFSGRASPGIDQIVFAVPANAPPGCYVPVQVRTSGRTVSNAVTMAISSDGGACSDPASPLDQNLLLGGNYGAVLAQRISGTVDQFLGSPPNFVFDLLGASLWREKGGPSAYNPLYSLPPRGSCTVFTVAGDLLSDTALPGLRPSDRALDGGSPLKLVGPGAAPALPLLGGAFFGLVGSNLAGSAT